MACLYVLWHVVMAVLVKMLLPMYEQLNPFLYTLKMPEFIEVRGEAYMPHSEFKRINEERDEEGLPTFVNPS